jgi:hypothetical protein
MLSRSAWGRSSGGGEGDLVRVAPYNYNESVFRALEVLVPWEVWIATGGARRF